jgi:putative sigma-54 modulation protein
MQVSVTFRHMEPTEALKEFAAEKVTRIEKFIHTPTDAHVVLSVEKYMHKADILIKAHGVMMRGQEKSEDMYASIDRAVDKIERQVKRYRNKLTNHKPREGQAYKVNLNYLEAQKEPDPEPQTDQMPHQIVETKEIEAHPMTVEEAVMQMDLLDNDFLVFLNVVSGEMNVLYRRKEGSYGLIEAPTREPARAAAAG